MDAIARLATPLLLAVGCSIAFVWPHQVAFWPDSVSYFASAESLLQHAALITHQNLPLTTFPPVYPVLAAAALSTGLDRQEAAFVVNLLAVAVIAAVVWRIAWSRTRSVGGTAAILLCSLVLGVVPARLHYAASELPFIALMLAALEQADDLTWRRGRRYAFGLGVLCALLFLTRYSGIVVVAFIGGWLVIDTWRLRRTRFVSALWFALGAAPLPLVWLCRNYLIEGALMGQRGRATGTLAEMLTGTASTLVDWVMPRIWWANSPREWIAVFSGVAAVFGLAIFAVRHRRAASTVRLYCLFSAAYIAFVAVTSLDAPIDIINERLLAPAYIPAIIGVGVAVATWWEPRPRRAGSLALAWTAVIAMLVGLGVAQARRRPKPELNYMAAEWRESPTTETVQDIPLSRRCFSNAPAPLYLWTGQRCQQALMELYRADDPLHDPLMEWVKTDEPTDAAYVWYYQINSERLVGDPAVLLRGHITRRHETADGEVLELRAGRVE